MMPRIEILDLAPRDAVDHFRAKGYHVGFDHRDTAAAEHLASFTVARVAQIDILVDIRKAVDAALAEGWTFRRFRGELEPLLRRKGWWGRRMMTDPLTGETLPVQLGSARRLGIILDTNLRMAWARGRWQAIRRLAHMRPWLRYVAIPDARTRPEHARWHGTVLRWDHPAWKTHYPPCGRNCRCTVRQLSDRDPERLGIKPSQAPPEDWSKTRPWHNARTGRTIEVPMGIDPGLGTMSASCAPMRPQGPSFAATATYSERVRAGRIRGLRSPRRQPPAKGAGTAEKCHRSQCSENTPETAISSPFKGAFGRETQRLLSFGPPDHTPKTDP